MIAGRGEPSRPTRSRPFRQRKNNKGSDCTTSVRAKSAFSEHPRAPSATRTKVIKARHHIEKTYSAKRVPNNRRTLTKCTQRRHVPGGEKKKKIKRRLAATGAPGRDVPAQQSRPSNNVTAADRLAAHQRVRPHSFGRERERTKELVWNACLHIHMKRRRVSHTPSLPPPCLGSVDDPKRGWPLNQFKIKSFILCDGNGG